MASLGKSLESKLSSPSATGDEADDEKEPTGKINRPLSRRCEEFVISIRDSIKPPRTEEAIEAFVAAVEKRFETLKKEAKSMLSVNQLPGAKKPRMVNSLSGDMVRNISIPGLHYATEDPTTWASFSRKWQYHITTRKPTQGLRNYLLHGVGADGEAKTKRTRGRKAKSAEVKSAAKPASVAAASADDSDLEPAVKEEDITREMLKIQARKRAQARLARERQEDHEEHLETLHDGELDPEEFDGYDKLLSARPITDLKIIRKDPKDVLAENVAEQLTPGVPKAYAKLAKPRAISEKVAEKTKKAVARATKAQATRYVSQSIKTPFQAVDPTHSNKTPMMPTRGTEPPQMEQGNLYELTASDIAAFL